MPRKTNTTASQKASLSGNSVSTAAADSLRRTLKKIDRKQTATSFSADNSPSAVQKTVLSNGLTVLSERVNTVRSVTVGLWTATGSRDEDETTNGMAHFIEHMVFKGTTHRNVVDISRSLEQVGGYLNAYTTKERTCFYGRVLDEFLPTAVDVVTDLVFYPTFPKDELDKEKDVIIEEIKSIDDDPDDAITEDFDALIYGKHPIGMPIGGTEKSVSAFTRKAALEFMKSRYTTDRMTLAAAGNVNHDALVKLAETLIPARPTPKPITRVSYSVSNYTPKVKEKKKAIQQAHMLIGFPFERNDESYYVMNLLNTILGGGMSSRLNLELREKNGLAYSVYSSFNVSDESNLFTVYIGTDGKKLDKAQTLIYRELEKVAEKTISPKELELAKAQLKGSVIMSQESMSARAGHLSEDYYYFGRFREIGEVIEQINSVSAASIRTMAETLFRPENYSVMKYIPKKSA